MGNKLCKKKSDDADGPKCKSTSQFDRIINRLHIRPNSWKSDPQLNQKQVKRIEKSPNEKNNAVITNKPLSKSTDWTEVDLQVPEKDEPIHLTNPKLNLIFNDDKGTPTPPPRKNKKKNLREKIEAVAKSGLQAFQSKKPVEDNQPQKQPVEEELCVKKTISYKCPICDLDEATHNRDHHHNHTHHHSDTKNDINKFETRNNKGSLKGKKTISVTSLPNYDELKFTVAEFEDDKGSPSLKTERKPTPSQISLPSDAKKIPAGKLDTYITRCRSFGSIFPQQLKKLRPRKAPTDIESDDSFGGLEDWDLGLIEHYNPKDASLPRPRKPKRNDDSILADIESMIVKEEDIEQPKPPVRRSESLIKKLNREAAQRSNDLIKKQQDKSVEHPTPPPSPETKPVVVETTISKGVARPELNRFPSQENGHVEHSSLIKILEKFSMADKQHLVNENNNSNESSLTPSLVEFEKTINFADDVNNVEKNKEAIIPENNSNQPIKT
ncbi:unnamed protein product [Phyllotreta striolata]|uniref:Uncharacterized protein n=1 Tax=Phyllotreta striolata TaxID=444603 RepID=A0A9N9THT4_PHYSR|nr:unnamed protein product [Phyllotreta striolata]